ncbi:MAG: hypothetical protein U0228_03160 [Myxococcaceae bacterium]
MIALGAQGCATTDSAHVAWPAPPARERVRLVKTLSGAGELESGIGRFFRKLSGGDEPHRMYHPVGVAVAKDGSLLAVSDQALAELFVFDFTADAVRVVPPEVLGGAPVGVAVDGDAVWAVVPSKKAVLRIGRSGAVERSLELDCERPVGVAVDVAHDRLFVSDASSPSGSGHVVHVHALSSGEHVSTFGARGEGQGQFFFPTFLAATPEGGLLVADTMNARVQELDGEGAFVRQFGERGDQVGQFDKPKGVALDAFGNVYVVDSFFSVVQIFNREGKLLLFFGGRGDSPGFLSNPAGIAIDGKNRIYVTNALNFRVEVYELVNTVAADSQLTGGR